MVAQSDQERTRPNDPNRWRQRTSSPPGKPSRWPGSCSTQCFERGPGGGGRVRFDAVVAPSDKTSREDLAAMATSDLLELHHRLTRQQRWLEHRWRAREGDAQIT